jgi:hypothetical protein
VLKEPPSSRHWNPETLSFAVNVKIALVELDGFGGVEPIVTDGPVVSTENVFAELSPVFPASSRCSDRAV